MPTPSLPTVGLGDEKLWLCPTLNDSANDISGNGNDGTYQGGMATVADTGAGGSLAYNHDTTGREILLPADLGISGDSMSISMWFNNTSNSVGSSADDWFGAYDATYANSNMRIYQFQNLILVDDRNETPDTFINPYTTLSTTNSWVHVVAVADGSAGEYRFYVDGVLADTVSSGGSDMTVKTTVPWRVGGGGISPSAIGMSDDIRAYDRVLTQAEIVHLAEARGIKGPPPVGLGDEKLWLCPSLNDSANDISGNGNNGTYQGGIGTVTDTGNGGSLAYNMSSTTTSRIALPTSVNTSFSSDSSVSIWFKYSGPIFNADPSAAFIGSGSTSGQWFHAGRFNNGGNQTGTYQSYADDGANNGLAGSSSVVDEEDNAWHHAVITRDYTSNESKTYVDGVLLGTSTFTSGTISTSHVHYIGYSVISSYGYSGATTNSGESLYYDDIRAYDRVLTPEEIKYLSRGRGIQGNRPEGLGDEYLWYSASLTGNSANIGDYDSTEMSMIPHGTASIGDAADGSNGVAFICPNISNSWRTDTNFDLDTEQTDTMSMTWWMGVDTMELGAVWPGFGLKTYQGQKWGTAMTNTLKGQFQWKNPNRQARNTTANIASRYSLPMTHFAIVVSVSGQYIRWYKNGVLFEEVAAGVTAVSGANAIAFGMGMGSSGGPTGGKFEDLRFFKRELEPSEIAHLSTQMGVLGEPPTGLGDEKLWLCPSLNDSANDISGNGNDGIYQGGMATIADTSNGGSLAYDFDGIDDYIDVVSSGVPAAAYSVSLWQYSTNSAVNTAFNAGQIGGERSVNIDGVRAATFGDSHGHKRGGTSYFVTSNAVRSSATWYHYLLTYDGSELKLYVNGTYVGNKTGVPNTDWIEDRCWIGQYIGGSYFFQGRMDDIRTYDRALTQSEIVHLAEARGIEGPPPVGLGDEKLWLCPSLNDSANDISGNGNNGTYQGGMATIADTGSGGSYAYEFDGIDDCITTTYGPTSTTSTGVFSMACWVKYDSVAANMSLMAGNVYTDRVGLSMTFDTYSSDRGHAGLLSRKLAGQYSSRIFAGDRDTTLTGQWYHIAYTGDGTTARLYVDGSEVANGLFSGFSALAWSNPLQIGRYIVASSTADGHLNGRLDDIRFFTRTITQSEITHLAEARGIEGPPPVGLGDEKLWLCPSINDSALDISGTGNNGTYQGGIGTVTDTGNGGSLAYNMSSTSTSRIELPNTLNSVLESSSTFTCWFKYTSPLASGDPETTFIGPLDSGIGLDWYGVVRTQGSGTSGTITSYADDGSNNGGVGFTDTVGEDGSWHHLSVTRDYTTDTAEIYIDGSSIGSGSFTSREPNTNQNHYIGWMNFFGYAGDLASSNELYFDDIRAYDRVLAQDEITHLSISRGIEGGPPVGLGDEKLWLCPSINDSANDISGNGNNGSYQGGMGTVADDSNGGSYAYEFDGVDDCITNSSLDLRNLSAMSWSAWVKDDKTSGLSTFFSHGKSGEYTNDTLFYQNAGDNRFQVNQTADGSGYTPKPTTSTWNHLAVVFDGSGASSSDRLRYFVNGVETSLAYDYLVPTATGNPSTSSTMIGNYVSSPTNFLLGRMDDIRVYDRALAQPEITYLATSRGIEGFPLFGLGDEIAWWLPSLGADSAYIDNEGSADMTPFNTSLIADTEEGGEFKYQFSGSASSYTDAGSSVVPSTEFSVSMWIKGSASSSEVDGVFSQSNINNHRGLLLGSYQNSGQGGDGAKLHAFYQSNPTTYNASQRIQSVATVFDNAWHHVVFTFKGGSRVNVYVDGVLDSTKSSSIPSAINVSWNTELGRYAGSNAFSGGVDDVRVYSRVIEADEVAWLSDSRGVLGSPPAIPVGLGDESLWVTPEFAGDLGNYALQIGTGVGTTTNTGNIPIVSDPDDASKGVMHFNNTSSTGRLTWNSGVHNNPYSISFWYRRGSDGSNDYLFSYTAANQALQFAFPLGNGTAWPWNDSGNLGTIPVDNTWHHAVYQREGYGTGASDISKLYIDGVLNASNKPDGSANGLWTGSYFDIGTQDRPYAGSSNWQGYLDDFRFYDRLITEEEITWLATQRNVQGPPATDLYIGNAECETSVDSFDVNLEFDLDVSESESKSNVDDVLLSIVPDDTVPTLTSSSQMLFADSVALGVARDIPIPSGTQAGDFILISIGLQFYGSTSQLTLSAGWEFVRASRNTGWIYYKYATASDVSSGNLGTVSLNGAIKLSASVTNWAGVDPTAPFTDSTADNFTTNTTDANTPGISATGSQVAFRSLCAYDNVALAGMTPDTGVTQVSHDDNTSGSDCTFVTGYDTASYVSGDTVPTQGWTSATAEPWLGSTLLLNGSSGYVQSTPVIESTAGEAAVAGTGPFAAPSGVAEGDLLVFAAVAATITESAIFSGWTSKFFSTDPSPFETVVWYKIAGASEPSSYSFSDTVSSVTGTMLRISGHDPNNPLGDFASTKFTGVRDMQYPAVATSAGDLVLRILSCDNDFSQVTWDGNKSLRVGSLDLAVQETSVADSTHHITADNLAIDGTTPAVTDSPTLTGEDYLAQSFVINAAAADPPSFSLTSIECDSTVDAIGIQVESDLLVDSSEVASECDSVSIQAPVDLLVIELDVDTDVQLPSVQQNPVPSGQQSETEVGDVNLSLDLVVAEAECATVAGSVVLVENSDLSQPVVADVDSGIESVSITVNADLSSPAEVDVRSNADSLLVIHNLAVRSTDSQTTVSDTSAQQNPETESSDIRTQLSPVGVVADLPVASANVDSEAGPVDITVNSDIAVDGCDIRTQNSLAFVVPEGKVIGTPFQVSCNIDQLSLVVNSDIAVTSLESATEASDTDLILDLSVSQPQSSTEVSDTGIALDLLVSETEVSSNADSLLVIHNLAVGSTDSHTTVTDAAAQQNPVAESSDIRTQLSPVGVIADVSASGSDVDSEVGSVAITVNSDIGVDGSDIRVQSSTASVVPEGQIAGSPFKVSCNIDQLSLVVNSDIEVDGSESSTEVSSADLVLDLAVSQPQSSTEVSGTGLVLDLLVSGADVSSNAESIVLGVTSDLAIDSADVRTQNSTASVVPEGQLGIPGVQVRTSVDKVDSTVNSDITVGDIQSATNINKPSIEESTTLFTSSADVDVNNDRVSIDGSIDIAVSDSDVLSQFSGVQVNPIYDLAVDSSDIRCQLASLSFGSSVADNIMLLDHKIRGLNRGINRGIL